MHKRVRTYTKITPDRTERPVTLVNRSEVVEAITTKDVSANYQKGAGMRAPKSFWIVISGGEKREKDYFKVLSKKDVFYRIKLDFIADSNRLHPDGILESARLLKERYSSSAYDDIEPDRYYLVTDVDHFYNDLVRIAPLCKSEGFNLIISNPCFEVWLYYAFYSELPAFRPPEDKLKISGKFKGWLNGTIPGGVKPTKAIFSIHQSIENAKQHYMLDMNHLPTLFSTSMFMLAEELLPLIDREIIQMIEDIDEKARLGRRGTV
jgi:hypothetical protein